MVWSERFNATHRPPPPPPLPPASLPASAMTLRDYFAAKAIAPMLDTADVPVKGWAEYVAGGAYHLADAMLKERESEHANFESLRERMVAALNAVLDEVGDGTGRTSVNSFLPQTLVDEIAIVLTAAEVA